MKKIPLIFAIHCILVGSLLAQSISPRTAEFENVPKNTNPLLADELLLFSSTEGGDLSTGIGKTPQSITINDLSTLLEANLTDNGVTYDDSALVNRVLSLENTPDLDTIYDDSALIGRLDSVDSELGVITAELGGAFTAISALEGQVLDSVGLLGRVEVLESGGFSGEINEINNNISNLEAVVLGNSALFGRVEALEASPDADTIYDDSVLTGRVDALENISIPEAYDDSNLSNRVLTLENAPDLDTVYDDSNLTGRVETLELKPDNDTIYDDSAVIGRLDVIEATPDNDTIYNDSVLEGRVAVLENAPAIEVYDDSVVVGRLDVIEATPDNDTIYDDTAVIGRLDAVEAESDGFLRIDDVSSNQTIEGASLSILPIVEFAGEVFFSNPSGAVDFSGRVQKATQSQEDIDSALNSVLNAEEGDARYVRSSEGLAGRLDVLESAPDNDTIYDDTVLTGRVEALESAPPVGAGSDVYVSSGSYSPVNGAITVPYTIETDGVATTWAEEALVLEVGGVEVATSNEDATNNPERPLSSSVADVRYNQQLLIRENIPANSTITVSFDPSFLLKSDFDSVVQFRSKSFYFLVNSNGRGGHMDHYYQRTPEEVTELVYEYHSGTNQFPPVIAFSYVSPTQIDVEIANPFNQTSQVSLLINN